MAVNINISLPSIAASNVAVPDTRRQAIIDNLNQQIANVDRRIRLTDKLITINNEGSDILRQSIELTRKHIETLKESRDLTYKHIETLKESRDLTYKHIETLKESRELVKESRDIVARMIEIYETLIAKYGPNARIIEGTNGKLILVKDVNNSQVPVQKQVCEAGTQTEECAQIATDNKEVLTKKLQPLINSKLMKCPLIYRSYLQSRANALIENKYNKYKDINIAQFLTIREQFTRDLDCEFATLILD
ncbi:hypothetical protein Trichorick_00760 [Candidatus Trichorickettsia mobilis]|uniref:Uncharacterized protein n=1 Tax=Candidatus Trichorickettsia mobilis TaxID=1346319 RepID=A0ABZ0US67_9RICK|nr:hypothetical protein [Candidatus Trichorickettsia mobilis]WPY00870.1 hypothetical protein Trichorick_00760 [Candidatus Trichorickettsia mobilis]